MAERFKFEPADRRLVVAIVMGLEGDIAGAASLLDDEGASPEISAEVAAKYLAARADEEEMDKFRDVRSQIKAAMTNESLQDSYFSAVPTSSMNRMAIDGGNEALQLIASGEKVEEPVEKKGFFIDV